MTDHSKSMRQRLTSAVILCGVLISTCVAMQDAPPSNPSETKQPAVAVQAPGTQSPVPQLDSKLVQQIKDALAKGFPLTTQTVADNVSVEAVLLPANVCKKVFGKEIAQNYATVELTISNRSQEQSLIVHSIFIDYSQWALSGSQYLADSDVSPQNPLVKGHNPQQSWQGSTLPNQISSVEYRVARGELLDAQTWTTRNWFMRALTVAGALGSAYSFSISEQGIIRGISAFSGQVIPAAQSFWPDETIGQMNRISDLGFQTNKVIAKGSSDIVVAFFPIDRFLTPGLKKLFLKSPALFFSPYALLFDSEGENALNEMFAPLLVNDPNVLSRLPKVYMQNYVACLNENSSGKRNSNAAPADCASDLQGVSKTDLNIIKFLAHASLNTIRVIVGGEMMVNVDRIPATITSVNFDDGNDKAATWGVGDHKGIIRGNYLKGGTITIDEAKQIGDPKITVDTENSNDQELHFSLALKQKVDPGTQLTFRVTKKDKDGNKVQGLPYVVPVQYTAAPATAPASAVPGADGATPATTTPAPAAPGVSAGKPVATPGGAATPAQNNKKKDDKKNSKPN